MMLLNYLNGIKVTKNLIVSQYLISQLLLTNSLMGNTLPVHRFYYSESHFFVTMVLHGLEYDVIDPRENTRYFALNEFNQPVTFSSYPDWRGHRPIMRIPVSIRDRLVQTKAPFKVMLMYGEGIKTFLVKFSENLDSVLTNNLYPYIQRDTNLIVDFENFRTNRTDIEGHFGTKSYLEIRNDEHEHNPLVIPTWLFRLIHNKLKYPRYEDDFDSYRLSGIKKIQVICDSEDSVGCLNLVI